MVSTRQEVSKLVADFFDRQYCVFVGRATTGIKLILDEFSIDGDVVYPAYTCPSPVYASVYSGANPVFCDVRPDYNMDIEELSKAVTDETEAVVPIHVFGHPAKMDEIKNICEDILVIEDACQAVGSKYKNKKTGSWGDVSVVSFGNKKPLEAGGGGAVLTDNEDIARNINSAESEIDIRDEDQMVALYDHYREIYYAIESLKDMNPAAEKLFKPFPEVFKELYLRGFDKNLLNNIKLAVETREEELSKREMHADIYRKHINCSEVTHPEPIGEAVYYRYSLLLETENMRDFVVSYLRERDFHVSTLYDTIHRRFGSDSEFPSASHLSKRTLNLWVSDVNEDYVRECSEAVVEALKEYRNE